MGPNGKLFECYSICATISHPLGEAELLVSWVELFLHKWHHQPTLPYPTI